MSEMELHTGKVKAVEVFEGETVDDVWLRLATEHGFIPENPLEDFRSDFGEYLYEKLGPGYVNRYVQVKDVIYEVIEDEEHEPYGFTRATKQPDGTISYILYWYNGGAGFGEVLEDTIKEIEE